RQKKVRGRDVNGVLLLNKPAGITSNEALQTVKRMFDAAKAGHTGSLDRPATGMLPICFGEATKFTSYLLNADKHYLAWCRLGVETSTADAEGEVLARKEVPVLSKRDIEQVLAGFKGDIQQVPPMHSALKHKGQRLYKLAYQGIEVEREPRPVSIYSIELIDFSKDQLQIAVHCSKGTYIRTLAEDIGKRIGCGAHITALSRVAVGPFTQDAMYGLDELRSLSEKGMGALDNLLQPVDMVIQQMPEIILTEAVSRYLEQGQPVIVPRAPTEGMLRIYNENHDFLGVGEVLDDGRIAPRRLISI
ncbi:MAG: tRNA pseudouridine(55) synthase TruB, partial [Gammaproteobacteria bacterium]